jgi:hypothetical protein
MFAPPRYRADGHVAIAIPLAIEANRTRLRDVLVNRGGAAP